MENEEKDFAELMSLHLDAAYNFVYRLTGGSGETADIVQETFIKVWKNLARYDRSKNFRTWLLSIARNTAIDHLRKKKVIFFSDFSENNEDGLRFEDSLPDLEPLPDEIFERRELASMLAEALSQIPLIYREVILLRYQNDLSFEEIAEVIGRPLNTVKSQNRRGLLSLRQYLTSAPK